MLILVKPFDPNLIVVVKIRKLPLCCYIVKFTVFSPVLFTMDYLINFFKLRFMLVIHKSSCNILVMFLKLRDVLITRS